MRGLRLILYLLENVSATSERKISGRLRPGSTPFHSRLSNSRPMGRIPLYLVKPRFNEEDLSRALLQLFGFDPAEGECRLDEIGQQVGSVRTILIDRDGQAWDLAEDRLFLCPERVYMDIYTGKAAMPSYSLPILPYEISWIDWEILLGRSQMKRLRTECGLGYSDDWVRIDDRDGSPPDGLIDDWASGKWDREDTLLAHNWIDSVSFEMNDAVWEAFRRKCEAAVHPTHQTSDLLKAPDTVTVTRVKGLIDFCFLEFLRDVESFDPLHRCRQCDAVNALMPRQHRDRLCDNCRSAKRLLEKRLWARRSRTGRQVFARRP